MEKNNFIERNKETTEMWSKIVGHKEKKQRTKKIKKIEIKLKIENRLKKLLERRDS